MVRNDRIMVHLREDTSIVLHIGRAESTNKPKVATPVAPIIRSSLFATLSNQPIAGVRSNIRQWTQPATKQRNLN